MLVMVGKEVGERRRDTETDDPIGGLAKSGVAEFLFVVLGS